MSIGLSIGVLHGQIPSGCVCPSAGAYFTGFPHFLEQPLDLAHVQCRQHFLETGQFDAGIAHVAHVPLQEFPSSSLDMKIDELVEQLGELGISLRGRIDYSCDYEGAYLWRYGRMHEEKTQAEVAIMDAGDQELIDELQRRGFHLELWHEPAPEVRGMVMG